MEVEGVEGQEPLGEGSRLFAGLAYLPPLLFLIPLLLVRGDPFARHHARQGFALHLAAVALVTWVELVAYLLSVIPLLGGLLLFLLRFILYAGLVGAAIAGVWHAARGEYWKLPFLGSYAEQLQI
ncbi:MAG: hypothetical protein ACE5JJ_05170 [Nitrospinota bacterium]